MTRVIVCNAFALSMLDRAQQARRVGDCSAPGPRIPLPCDDPRAFLAQWEAAGATVESAVGHADVAALLGAALGRQVAENRRSIQLGPDDIALIGAYVGPRLAAGTTTLPTGAKIEWWIV